MAVARDRRPLPAGPIIRLAVAVLLLVFLAIRGLRTGMPPVGLIVIALGLILVAAEQVRRIWISRRPPMEEQVSKHPLGLN